MTAEIETPILSGGDCLEIRLVLSEFERKGVEVRKDISGNGREIELLIAEDTYDTYSLILDWLYGFGEEDLSKELGVNIKDYANGKRANIPFEKYGITFYSYTGGIIEHNGRCYFLDGDCNFMLTYNDDSKDLICGTVGFDITEPGSSLPIRAVINHIHRYEKELCKGINWKKLLISGAVSKWLGRFPEIKWLDIIQGKDSNAVGDREGEFVFTEQHAKLMYDFTAKRLRFDFDKTTGTYFRYIEHK